MTDNLVLIKENIDKVLKSLPPIKRNEDIIQIIQAQCQLQIAMEIQKFRKVVERIEVCLERIEERLELSGI